MSWFVDEVSIRVEAGRGGDGCVAFRREKYVPRGGPSGGDGGDGGNVVLVADERLRTLLDLRPARLVKAPPGGPGQGKQMCGARGVDREVPVPVGTLVREVGLSEPLADLTAHGQRFVVARGGHGGRGNLHFATSTNRAPRRAEEGRPGEARDLVLELKLMADVGLLGFPNVGKSTFIRRVSRARPKVASYPFTTLVPSLGVCELSDHRTLVVADIPGLVQGASEGAGLGHQFLRHLERTAVLLHLLDPSDPTHGSPLEAHDGLNAELAAYSERLASLPQVVAVNKVDLPEVEGEIEALRVAFGERGIAVHAISGATGAGVPELIQELWDKVTTVAGSSEE